MGYRKGYFRKDGTYVQGHYANNRSKSFSRKNKGGCILLSALTLLGTAISCSDSSDTTSSNGSGSGSSSNCPTKTCGDFATRAQAQAAYNSNKSCYKNLDADGDGIACESLK